MYVWQHLTWPLAACHCWQVFGFLAQVFVHTRIVGIASGTWTWTCSDLFEHVTRSFSISAGVTRPSRNRIVADWHVCVIYVPSAHKIRQVRRQTETPVGETASVCTVTGESTTCVTHRRRIFTHVSSSSETDRWGIARNHRRDTQVRSGCRTWTFQQQTASVLTITMLRYFRFHCSSVNFKQDVRKIQRNVTQAKTKPITWVCLV